MQKIQISTAQDYKDITGHDPYEKDQCPVCGMKLVKSESFNPDGDMGSIEIDWVCPDNHNLEESEVI